MNNSIMPWYVSLTLLNNAHTLASSGQRSGPYPDWFIYFIIVCGVLIVAAFAYLFYDGWIK